MLRRRDVAEEVRAVVGAEGTADGGVDMVVAHGDVGEQRPENEIGRAFAQRFFQRHGGFHMVDGHMPGAFDHDLYAGFLRPLHEIAQEYQFFDHGAVEGIGDAAGAVGVGQRQRHIVFFADFKEPVVLFQQGIFLLIVDHPAHEMTAAEADHGIDPAAFFDMLNHF